MKSVTNFRILGAALAMVLAATNVCAEDESPESADSSSSASSARGQRDRLDLDATYVKGNQELPKVLVIVPWKESQIGDLSGKPVNSLLDEVLAPLDREVFQRQVRYFDQLHVSESGGPAGAE